MYAVVWQYIVKPETVEQFQKVYAPDGTWAELFARSEGYLGSELYRSTTQPEMFVTLDRWRSRDTFADFMAAHGPAYAQLDKRYAELTVVETRLGELDGGNVLVSLGTGKR